MKKDVGSFVLSETILAIGRQLKDMVSPFPDKPQVSEGSSSGLNICPVSVPLLCEDKVLLC